VTDAFVASLMITALAAAAALLLIVIWSLWK